MHRKRGYEDIGDKLAVHGTDTGNVLVTFAHDIGDLEVLVEVDAFG